MLSILETILNEMVYPSNHPIAKKAKRVDVTSAHIIAAKKGFAAYNEQKARETAARQKKRELEGKKPAYLQHNKVFPMFPKKKPSNNLLDKHDDHQLYGKVSDQ
jgi:hypothetical protein